MIMKKTLLLASCLLLLASSAWARIYIPVDQPSDKLFPIAVTELVGLDGMRGSKLTEKVPDIIKNDLTISGYFQVIPDSAFLDASEALTSDTINFAKWTALEAGGLVKGSIKRKGGEYTVQLKLFDPYSAQLLVGKQYTSNEKNLRSVAHRFSDDIMEALTGKRGIFNTKIAYTAMSGRGNKPIYVMDVDGENNFRVTPDSSINLGPSWSPDGSMLTFASYKKGNPEIFFVNLGNGNMRQLTNNKNTNITPAFLTNNLIYYASSLGYSTELFTKSIRGGKERQLTSNSGINLAPRFSKDGGTMVYSSTLPGRLHVFRTTPEGGLGTRLTFVGVHNDSPDISPDGTKITFCGQDSGTFDIFVMNSDGSNIQRLTIDSGSNEHPRWSPDGRYIVFSSTRKEGAGIYMMRADGANQVKMSKGGGQLPDWGPWLK
ncbi:MAG: Tol-Pal system beta propeller repeat protein TolB [Deltaproteobacteria bacterium CG11_big_fil_rev_8_21_14_0_20_49_13]|nr:MAG: Tol-Pal system beta propeller repeat protein TolB [Deltaproteobacteria bacterium CG11_big_fil_rev_8_21_14_0_20_49_13]